MALKSYSKNHIDAVIDKQGGISLDLQEFTVSPMFPNEKKLGS